MNKQLFNFSMFVLGIGSIILYLIVPSNNDPNLTNLYGGLSFILIKSYRLFFK